jgi:hypothetical protein
VRLVGTVLVTAAVVAAGCGGSSGSDLTDPNPSGGPGHINTDAVQNCIDNGNDEKTCKEIWQVK